MKQLIILTGLFLSVNQLHAQCSDLFFSEYLEGSSNNKAIEIYNPTASGIDLSDYVIYRYNNGSPIASDSLHPVGILNSQDVYIAGNPSAVAGILTPSDTLHTITFFNGDDAMALKKVSTGQVLDIIGVIGVDPGTNWPVGTGATSEFTLIRNIGIQSGQVNWAIGASEWDVYPQNMLDSLGMHTMTACAVVIDPTISLDVNSQVVNEGAGTVTVSLIITNPNANPTSVDLTLNVGSSTATNGSDFTFTSPTTVTFPGGSSANQTVIIPITDDAIFESLETIVLDLINPTNNASIGSFGTQTISIDDNELGADFGACSDLFFSEYLEGSSNNKAIEIYNPKCNAVDLGNYQVQRFTNGSATASGTYTFAPGTMLAGQDVYVIGNSSADSVLALVFDTTNAATLFNGDDALTLMNIVTGDTLDIIGVVGVDPGTNWVVGLGATSEYTLVRSANIHDGTTDWNISQGQWEVFPQNMFDSLGTHYATSCADSATASFTTPALVVCLGSSICFTNTTVGGGCSSSQLWDFGDGGTSMQYSPCHTYASIGNYICTLAVTGSVNTSISTLSISVTETSASLDSLPFMCVYDSPITLTQGSPAGGTYSGTGVSGGSTFDPAAAGAGTHTITYTYTDANSCTATATTDVSVYECLGLNELEQSHVTVYPNPGNSVITLNSASEILKVQLFDLSGTLVGTYTTQELSIDHLSNGTYILQIETVLGSVNKRFIKQ